MNRPRSLPLAIRVAILAVCSFGVISCSHEDPLEHLVAASSEVGLLVWKGKFAGDLTPDDRKAFDEAVQEIKFAASSPGGAVDGATVDEQVYGKINGVSVRGVLLTGYGFKLKRLTTERSAREEIITKNSRLRTREGDDASADYLKNFRAGQAKQLADLNAEIARTEVVLRRFGGLASPKVTPAAGTL